MRMHFWAVAMACLVSGLCRAQEKLSSTMVTRWAQKVTPENAHREYPRPQMKREQWQNLNGLWDYAIAPKEAASFPAKAQGKILVPFPVESKLSGVRKTVGADRSLWYRHTFPAPTLKGTERLLLHFGGVDWHAKVSLNGKAIGEHKGGYTAFRFDVTDALKKEGKQELIVKVTDPSDQGYQPRGKQVTKPRGIWYTSVTGIWQTVWLEKVPSTSIERLKLTPDLTRKSLFLSIFTRGKSNGTRAKATALADGKVVARAEGPVGEQLELSIAEPKLWSPSSPFLYDLKVELMREKETVDQVTGYFGMRSIALGKDRDGFLRLFLNGKPLFQYGPLDQGWWPDGLYTAPTDEALRYDLEVTKKLGFNMVRKHVKVEPARWYYHCDKLGLLVWQDMPNGDRHIRKGAPDIQRSEESAANYRREYREMIDGLFNHPSIVVWVPFNEGWGQFQTHQILAWTKLYDPSRLVDGPSGWTDRGTGDLHDMHRYPGPAMPPVEKERVVVLGEFGGLGLPLQGHLWWDKRNWGYRTYKSRKELRSHYRQLIRQLRPLIGKGLAAAVYTQTTDVEGEVNGFMTYDRAVIKFDVDAMAKLHEKLYQRQPTFVTRVIVPTSEEEAQTWHYTTDNPGKEWHQPDFDHSKWKKGKGGFGTRMTPGAKVGTVWSTKDIWLRKPFTVKEGASGLRLRIHHDEDAEVYLNGKKIATFTGYLVSYLTLDLEEGLDQIGAGEHVLAVHCRQTLGGQYIDVGLVEIKELPRGPDGKDD